MKKSVLILSTTVFLFTSPLILLSQTGGGSPPVLLTPSGVFDEVKDQFGNTYYLSNLALNSTKTIGGGTNTTNSAPTESCQAGHFTLFFDAGSVFTAGSQSLQAQAVACELFSNLSTFIQSTITAGSIRINLYALPTSSVPYAVGTTFFAFPAAITNYNGAVMLNLVQTALISGVDPYSTFPIAANVPGNSFYHGSIGVRSNVNWNVSMTTATIGSSEFSLMSVLLHEAMHVLGVLSLIDENGNSQIGANFFSTFDQFLYDYNSNPLLASSTPSCPNSNISFNTASVSLSAISASGACTNPTPFVTTCSTAVQYSSNNVQVKVFTPDCWIDGSSLSHLEDMCTTSNFTPTGVAGCTPAPTSQGFNNHYFVVSDYTDAGPCYVKNYPKEEERCILKDLGYTIPTTSYTSNALINGTSTVAVYSNTCSTNALIVGLNDGYNNGVYSYTTFGSSIAITFTDLAINDLPTGATTPTCIEVITSGVTYSLGSTDFTVFASPGTGFVVLKYVPTDGFGHYGNATFVYCYFYAPGCVPNNGCTLVNNGGFESSVVLNSVSACGYLDPGPLPNLYLNCWQTYNPIPAAPNSIDLLATACSNSANYGLGIGYANISPPVNALNLGTTTNTQCVVLRYPGHGNPGALKTDLIYQLVPTQTYQVSFWAINYEAAPGWATPINTDNNPIVLTLASKAILTPPSSLVFPTTLDPLVSFTINPGNVWTHITNTFVFTPTVGAQTILIGINPTLTTPPNTVSPNNYGYSCFMDEFSIELVSQESITIPTLSVCVGQSILNLTASTNGTFTGAGVTYSASQYDFNLNGSLAPGSYPIAFNYSNGFCVTTIYETLTVVSNPNFVPSGTLNLCLSNPTLNLNSFLVSTTITGTTYSIGGIQVSSPYTFTATGQYTLSASNTSTTLCSSSIYTTLVNVYDAATPWFTNAGYTVSSATICPTQSYSVTANTGNTNIDWQPGGLINASEILTPTVTTIYTVTVFDYSLCATSNIFAVIVATNCCNGNLLTPLTGTAISALTVINGGSLLISNDVTITQSNYVTIANCNVKFLNNAKIIIEGSSILTLNGSHLSSCDDNMWHGIVLNDGAKLITGAGSSRDNLIEDAIVAIDVSNYTNTAVSTILDIHNTTFNKNYTSISVSNYTETISPYPFKIDNCVFTCRDIPTTFTAWPSVGSTSSVATVAAQLRTAINSTADVSPPYLSQTGFSITTLKSPHLNKHSRVAIELNNVGATNGTSMYGAVIGSTANASDFNLFDAHNFLIQCLNSNLSCMNNVFQNTLREYFASTSTLITTYHLEGGTAIEHVTNTQMNTKLDLTASNSNLGNRFWDCHYAVSGDQTYKFDISNAIFRSTQSSTLIPPVITSNWLGANNTSPGQSAIVLNSSRFEQSIEYNEFSNINAGIQLGSLPLGYIIPNYTNTTQGIYAGNISIKNNTFSPVPSLTTTSVGNNYLNVAMSMHIPFSTTMQIAPGSSLTVQDNILDRVFRGIFINGMSGLPTLVKSNTVTILSDNMYYGSQNAIEMDNTIGSATNVTNNVIEDNSLSCVPNSTANLQSSLIFCGMNIGPLSPRVICNDLKWANQGFVFHSSNAGAYWRGNTMEDLGKGLVLMENGIMGVQGGSLAPIDNMWNGSWATYTQTSVEDISDASNSKLWVQSGSPWEPTANSGLFTQNYTYSNNINIISSGSYTCGAGPNQIVINIPNNDDDYYSSEYYFIMRNSLYHLLHFNESIRIGETVLEDFYTTESASTIGIFMEIEENLYQGNYTTAHFLNDALDSDDLNVVELNYKIFYNLYMKALDPDEGGLSSADSSALRDLAYLCPGENGACIYQARALYKILSKQPLYFLNECGEELGARFANSAEKAKANKIIDVDLGIKIFPNPAQDIITLFGKKESEGLVIMFKDVSGRIVLQENLKTNNFMAKLEINLINGLYFVTITNTQNENITKKLLISK